MAKKNNICEVTFKQGTKKIVVTFTEDENNLLSYQTDMEKFGEVKDTPAKIALGLANFFLAALNQAFKETPSNEETPVEATPTSEN